MTIAALAAGAGKGLLAGAIGTVAMTLSSTLEMKLRDRKGSTAPADAASKVLGVEPVDEAASARFATIVHWGYGTAWGSVRGLLAGFGMHGWAVDAAHFAAVWGTELAMLPALDVAPPPQERDPQELAIDAFHHLVYVAATGWAYRALDRH